MVVRPRQRTAARAPSRKKHAVETTRTQILQNRPSPLGPPWRVGTPWIAIRVFSKRRNITMNRRRWLLLGLVFVAIMINYVDRGNLSIAAPDKIGRASCRERGEIW